MQKQALDEAAQDANRVCRERLGAEREGARSGRGSSGLLELGFERDGARRVQIVERHLVGALLGIDRQHAPGAERRMRHAVAHREARVADEVGDPPVGERVGCARVVELALGGLVRELERRRVDVQQEARGIARRALVAAPFRLGEVQPASWPRTPAAAPPPCLAACRSCATGARPRSSSRGTRARTPDPWPHGRS